jgi:hypothetical protein
MSDAAVAIGKVLVYNRVPRDDIESLSGSCLYMSRHQQYV